MWHRVSEKEPPKDGRFYRFCGRRGEWQDAAWMGGTWVDETGEPCDSVPLVSDEWTLAPGQEEREGEAGFSRRPVLNLTEADRG